MSSKDLDKLMAKLDQDNRVLAELDRKVKEISSGGMSSSLPTLLPTHQLYSHRTLGHLVTSSQQAIGQAQQRHLQQQQQQNLAYSVSKQPHLQLVLPGLPINANHVNYGLTQQVTQKLEQLKLAEDVVDTIEIPNRGRCKVFIAKYSYDPFKQSPNENPEAELNLNAGDFVLIFSEMDEDGFFFGELLDGRRGVVPSNFVEKLTGEDLFEFQATVLYGQRDGDHESNASYPPEFYDAILNDAMGHTNFQHLLAPEDFHRMNDYVELAESADIDEEDLSDIERAQAVAARDPGKCVKRWSE